MIDALVQPIPVDAVIIALPSDLLSLIVTATCHTPGQRHWRPPWSRSLLFLLSSVESCQSSPLAPLPKPLRPGTLAASRGPGSTSGCAPSRPCAAVTLCQSWRSVNVSQLLVTAYCRTQPARSVPCSCTLTHPHECEGHRQDPSPSTLKRDKDLRAATPQRLPNHVDPQLSSPAGQVCSEMHCWSCCETVRFGHSHRPARPASDGRDGRTARLPLASVGKLSES